MNCGNTFQRLSGKPVLIQRAVHRLRDVRQGIDERAVEIENKCFHECVGHEARMCAWRNANPSTGQQSV